MCLKNVPSHGGKGETMKKPLFSRDRIGSFHVMIGVCFILMTLNIHKTGMPAGKAEEWFLFSEPYAFHYSGLERTLDYSPETNFDTRANCKTPGMSFPSRRESSLFKTFWTPDFAEVTVFSSFAINSIKTFFTGKPHGKWTLTDIWASLTDSSGPVPEPSTILILGSGLIGIALFGRRPND
jgi:hypothetical protein